MQNHELKKISYQKSNVYYFDDIIKLEDFDLGNVFIDERSHENILICDISCKTLIGSKLLRIRFDKTDEIIRIYDRSRYLILFGNKRYDAIYDKIRYLISIKTGITYIISRYFAKIKVDSYNYLPIEKTFSLHNVIIDIKSVLNKNKNHYYYKIFLEKCSYQLSTK